MPRTRRIVDRWERVRLVYTGLILSLLVVLFATVTFVVLRPYTGPDTAGVIGLLAGLVTLASAAVTMRRQWRLRALVEVRADGIRIRTGHHLADRAPVVPWSEMTGVGIAPASPVDDPGITGDGAVREWIDVEDALGGVSTAGYRWRARKGRVRVVIGLHRGSSTQAAEFAARVGALHHLVAAGSGRPAAGPVASVVRSLKDWQCRWSATPQRVGLHVVVPERARAPLEDAVAAFRPGWTVTRLPALSHAELDTPHDIAQAAHLRAFVVLSPPT